MPSCWAFWGHPETGRQENILWVYNFSDVTFEVRAVFPDVALDTSFVVTPEGNKRGFYGETWIYTGFRVPFQDPPVIRGRLYTRSLDADRPINFTLTRSWYGNGR